MWSVGPLPQTEQCGLSVCCHRRSSVVSLSVATDREQCGLLGRCHRQRAVWSVCLLPQTEVCGNKQISQCGLSVCCHRQSRVVCWAVATDRAVWSVCLLPQTESSVVCWAVATDGAVWSVALGITVSKHWSEMTLMHTEEIIHRYVFDMIASESGWTCWFCLISSLPLRLLMVVMCSPAFACVFVRKLWVGCHEIWRLHRLSTRDKISEGCS